MWYELDHPATWAGLNEFLSGVLSLFSDMFSAMLGQPVLVLFMAALLMAWCLVWSVSCSGLVKSNTPDWTAIVSCHVGCVTKMKGVSV